MTFSYSSWRTYQKCQRMWLYSSSIKSSIAKDALRKKVSILSNLQSIDAWRGEIVDFTISNYVVRNYNMNIYVTLEDTIKYAKDICRKRYEFAKEKRYWNENIVKSHYPEEYSALFDFEFNTGIKDKDFQRPWKDIEISLTNFFENEELIYLLEDKNSQLIAQRPLHLKLNGFNIKGIPDLIVFNKNKPPHIIDWKVNFSGNKTYNEQLLIYAFALNQSNHKDFPTSFTNYSILDYQLSEYQLLIDEFRNYPITENYLEEIENFLAESTYQLSLAGAEAEYKDIDYEDFEITNDPEKCLICPYHKICNHEN